MEIQAFYKTVSYMMPGNTVSSLMSPQIQMWCIRKGTCTWKDPRDSTGVNSQQVDKALENHDPFGTHMKHKKIFRI